MQLIRAGDLLDKDINSDPETGGMAVWGRDTAAGARNRGRNRRSLCVRCAEK